MPKAKSSKKATPGRRPFRDDPGKWRRTRPYMEMWSCPEGIPAKLMRHEFEIMNSHLPSDQVVTFHFVVCRIPPFSTAIR